MAKAHKLILYYRHQTCSIAPLAHVIYHGRRQSAAQGVTFYIRYTLDLTGTEQRRSTRLIAKCVARFARCFSAAYVVLCLMTRTSYIRKLNNFMMR
jgi:hypothetical protein